MSNRLQQAEKAISQIDEAISQNSEEFGAKIKEVRANPDFTDGAKSRMINGLELKRGKKYKELQDQKAQVVQNAKSSIRKSIYTSEKVTDPLRFDEVVSRMRGMKSGELIKMVESSPEPETLNAILKASVSSDLLKFEVLERIATLYPEKEKTISDVFAIEQKYGQLESRSDRLARRIFGETA